MPGTDPHEAARVIVGELTDFPYLAELPDRGPGADLTGRAAALLVDMPTETTPRGWRLAERACRDLSRARSMLSSDLDILEEVLQGFTGPVKIALCGPWTLASTLELPRTMNMALADPGAVADLTASLAEGAAAYVADVARRVPGARLIFQLDEPALPSVLEGLVPTQSGLSLLAAVEEHTAIERLTQILGAVSAYTVVHCCAAGVPFGIIQQAGANGISFDLSQLRRGEQDAIAEAAEAGLGLLIGAVPTATTGEPRRGTRDGRTGDPAVAADRLAVADGRAAGGDHARPVAWPGRRRRRPARCWPGAGRRPPSCRR